MERIDKLLSDCGLGTRSDVKKLIRKGLIRVDDVVVTDPGARISPDTQTIYYNKEPLHYEQFLYYVLHKPAGVVSAVTDANERTVMSYVKGVPVKNCFPVGRLDKDTEGLLLITNNGALSHNLLSPKKHIEKCYAALVKETLPDDAAAQFAQGIAIGDDTPTLPAKLQLPDTEDIFKPFSSYYQEVRQKYNESLLTPVLIVLHEGRYHQVKRMIQALGCEVVYLKRLSMGALTLDSQLKPGEFQQLTQKEIERIFASSL